MDVSNLILDLGRYWYKVTKRRGKDSLLRAVAPLKEDDTVAASQWESVNIYAENNMLLIKKIDDFFGTRFSSKTNKIKEKIYKIGEYKYRIIAVEDKNQLQRAKLPKISYINQSITATRLPWEVVHDGEMLLTKINKELSKT
jgi:hypothetical protein